MDSGQETLFSQKQSLTPSITTPLPVIQFHAGLTESPFTPTPSSAISSNSSGIVKGKKCKTITENTSNRIASTQALKNVEEIPDEYTKELRVLELRSARLAMEQKELELEERKVALLERKRALGM